MLSIDLFIAFVTLSRVLSGIVYGWYLGQVIGLTFITSLDLLHGLSDDTNIEDYTRSYRQAVFYHVTLAMLAIAYRQFLTWGFPHVG